MINTVDEKEANVMASYRIEYETEIGCFTTCVTSDTLQKYDPCSAWWAAVGFLRERRPGAKLLGLGTIR